jgi:uncharacterized protein with FMN-binding domain
VGKTVIASRTSRALAAACVAASVALFAGGCGSKSSSTASSGTPKATTSATAAARAKYHAGEYCATSKEPVYRKLGLTCVNGRLKKT